MELQKIMKSLNFMKILELGYEKCCTNLGTLYVNGYGVSTDIKKLRRVFIKGCDLGHEQGCN